MPVGAAIAYWGIHLGEQRYEERQLMQADDDGMLERFIALEGVKQPRMLSWAELRALRHDRAAFAEFAWPQYAALKEWQKDLLNKVDTDTWKKQYMMDWPTPHECKCPAGPDRKLRSTSSERWFRCSVCDGYVVRPPSRVRHGLGSDAWRESDIDQTEFGGEL